MGEEKISKYTQQNNSGNSVALLIANRKLNFLISHQITLWKKDFLLGQEELNEHPKEIKDVELKESKNLIQHSYQIDYFAGNGKGENNKSKNPQIRSEYFTVSVNAMLSSSKIQYYIDQLIKKQIRNRLRQ